MIRSMSYVGHFFCVSENKTIARIRCFSQVLMLAIVWYIFIKVAFTVRYRNRVTWSYTSNDTILSYSSKCILMRKTYQMSQRNLNSKYKEVSISKASNGFIYRKLRLMLWRNVMIENKNVFYEKLCNFQLIYILF